MISNESIVVDYEIKCYRCGKALDIEEIVCDNCGALVKKEQDNDGGE